MPTNTFFRLPEEKQRRLIDAAWQEFTRVSCTEASINRIIQAAKIPRGSFYQYFADKEDLFLFLLRDLGRDFSELLLQTLQIHNGDLSASLLAAFDGWFLRANVPVLSTFRKRMLLLKNPSLDWQQIVFPSQMSSSLRCAQSPPAALLTVPAYAGHLETADNLAIAAFTGICKQCFFMPENAAVFRRNLAQTFWLICRVTAAAPFAEPS